MNVILIGYQILCRYTIIAHISGRHLDSDRLSFCPFFSAITLSVLLFFFRPLRCLSFCLFLSAITLSVLLFFFRPLRCLSFNLRIVITPFSIFKLSRGLASEKGHKCFHRVDTSDRQFVF